MKNSKHGMMFRIASLFMVFIVLIIIETGYSTYYHQEKVYRELLQDRTEKMGRYLASLLEMDQDISVRKK